MNRAFDRFATWMALAIGRPITFVFSLAIVSSALSASIAVPSLREPINLWAGALGSYVTLIMLVVLQNGQNRQGAAAALKADELIRVTEAAEDRLIGAEERTADEIAALKK